MNLQSTKKIPVIFYNLLGYDSHLIFCELNKFDVKIDVIDNGLENCIAFILNKNLVFIGSMQFMNSSLKKLVKNLSDNDFKYLTEEFGSKNLELLRVITGKKHPKIKLQPLRKIRILAFESLVHQINFFFKRF